MLGGDQPPHVEVTPPTIPPKSGATVRDVRETPKASVLVPTAGQAMASATTEGGDGGDVSAVVGEESRSMEARMDGSEGLMGTEA